MRDLRELPQDERNLISAVNDIVDNLNRNTSVSLVIYCQQKEKSTNNITLKDIEYLMYYIERNKTDKPSVLIYHNTLDGTSILSDYENPVQDMNVNDRMSFVLYENYDLKEYNSVSFVTFNCKEVINDTIKFILGIKIKEKNLNTFYLP